MCGSPLNINMRRCLAENFLPLSNRVPNLITIETLKEIKEHPERLEKTSLDQLEKDWEDGKVRENS